MRQVTGSNPICSQDKISVRLDASGDLFVLEDVMNHLPPHCAEGEVLQIELLTKRMMLLPTTLLRGGEAEGCDAVAIAQGELSKMGITIHRDEQLVSLSREELTALVVVPKSLIEAIEERYGDDGVSFDVPMLRSAASQEREHMVVDSHLGITVIKIFTPQSSGVELKFADIYDTPTDASTIYWVQRVASAVGLGSATPIYIYRCSGIVRRGLVRNFKKILICE